MPDGKKSLMRSTALPSSIKLQLRFEFNLYIHDMYSHRYVYLYIYNRLYPNLYLGQEKNGQISNSPKKSSPQVQYHGDWRRPAGPQPCLDPDRGSLVAMLIGSASISGISGGGDTDAPPESETDIGRHLIAY